MEFSLIQKVAIFALPVIFAITLHEAAYAYAAKHFGDTTAEAAGRLSLNPVNHIDLVGTILVPLAALILGGVIFGWAKPVPVDYGQMRAPKQDMFWIAAAGIGSNLAMALTWGFVLKMAPAWMPENFVMPITLMAQAGIMVNAVLMVVNLLPVPPLDGGRIVVSLLPHPYAWQFAKLERFGFIILIVLLFTGILGKILWPFVNASMSAISWLFS